MIHFLVPAAQDIGIKDYLDVSGESLRNDIRVLHYEDLPKQREFVPGTYVLSALDQLNPALTKLVRVIHLQLKQTNGVRFLNDPERTLKRFDLLTELNSRGMNDFRVARATRDLRSLRFPVFLREERLHNGAISPLLNSEREVGHAIGQAIVQGHELHDLLIVEFCDTANENGFYRKYGAFIVGDRVIPRSLNYGRHWMLKYAETEYTMAIVQEELKYVSENAHQKKLLEIFRVAQVEYGRIDYAIKNGKIQTWEINLNPTIGRGLRPRSKNISAELDAVRDEVRRCFYQRFERAWRAVDLPNYPEKPIYVYLAAGLVKSAMVPDPLRGRFLKVVKTVVRPIKPLITPLTPPVLIALGWLARRSGRKHE